MTDRVTEEQIESARSLGACESALIKLPTMAVDAAVKRYAKWLLTYAADRLTDDQFATAVEARPWTALMYATDRLTDEQFATAAEAEPWYARQCAPKRYHAMQEASA